MPMCWGRFIIFSPGGWVMVGNIHDLASEAQVGSPFGKREAWTRALARAAQRSSPNCASFFLWERNNNLGMGLVLFFQRSIQTHASEVAVCLKKNYSINNMHSYIKQFLHIYHFFILTYKNFSRRHVDNVDLEVCLVLHTSGTTKKPKIVPITCWSSASSAQIAGAWEEIMAQ